MKDRILQEVGRRLRERGGSRGLNLRKSLVWSAHNHDVAVLRQAGQYRSGQYISLTTRGTAMEIRKENVKKNRKKERVEAL
jgi:hypothetical protein